MEIATQNAKTMRFLEFAKEPGVNRLIMLILAVSLMACQAPALQPPKSEAEAIKETELLIRYSLTGRIIQDVESRYRDQFSSMFTAAGDSAKDVSRIVDEEMRKLIEVEHQRLLDNLVPVYRGFFSAVEIHQLLSFYQTDVARKSLSVSRQIAAQSRQYIRLWNDHFEESLLQRIDARLSEAGINPKP